MLIKVHEDGLLINLQKCSLIGPKQNVSDTKSLTGISPLKIKTAAFFTIPPPNTLEQLRSILVSVHYINKFIPNLANFGHPLRPLLKKYY